jgi:hypothetical protein
MSIRSTDKLAGRLLLFAMALFAQPPPSNGMAVFELRKNQLFGGRKSQGSDTRVSLSGHPRSSPDTIFDTVLQNKAAEVIILELERTFEKAFELLSELKTRVQAEVVFQV